MSRLLDMETPTMTLRLIAAAIVAVGCATAFGRGDEAALAQGRGAGTAPAPGRGGQAPVPGRGGAGPGARGPAAPTAPAEPRGLRVKTDEATPGYLLFAPLNSDLTFLVDNDGAVVRTWKSSFAPAGAIKFLDNGNFIRSGSEPGTKGFSGGGQGGRLQEFSFDGSLLWDYSFNDATHLLHHDFAVLPNGNVLAIAWELKSADEAKRVGRNAGFIPATGIWPDKIVELAPQRPINARIVWEWHAWDHLVQNIEPMLPNHANPADRPERIDINGDILGVTPAPKNPPADFLHTNSIAYNAELDQIVLSVPRFNEIWVIDHSTSTAEASGSTGGRAGRGGDLLYRWGNPQAYGRGTEADRRFGFQHDARWIPQKYPGAGNMMVFSNRSGGPGPGAAQTTVYEFTPPVEQNRRYTLAAGRAYGPAEPVWTYSAADFTAQYISGAERLPDGKTLVSSGPQGRVFEITADGKIVWEYWSRYSGSLGGAQGQANPFALFRAIRVPATHPVVAKRPLKPLDPQPALRSPE